MTNSGAPEEFVAAFDSNSELRELLNTPLWLNIVLLTYRDFPDLEIPSCRSSAELQGMILAHYLDYMFKRPRAADVVPKGASRNNVHRSPKKPSYKREQAEHWLSSLAVSMVRLNQIPFALEALNRNWLSPSQQRKAERVFRIAVGLAVGLTIALLPALSLDWDLGFPDQTPAKAAFGLPYALALWLLLGLPNGLVIGLVFGRSVSLVDRPGEGPAKSFAHILRSARSLGGSWLGYGLLYWFVAWLINALLLDALGGGWLRSLTLGWFPALVSGLTAGLATELGFDRSQARPADRLKWSWQDARYGIGGRLLRGLIFGLVPGLIFGLILGLVLRADGGRAEDLVIVIGTSGLMGALIGLFLALFFALPAGLVAREVSVRTERNERTWRSGRNGLLAGLGAWVAIGSVGVIIRSVALVEWGLIVGLIVGLQKGGIFFLRHWAVRIALWRYNSAPFRYVPFLDYAADRIFLQRVRGGYLFIHPILMKYFILLASDTSK